MNRNYLGEWRSVSSRNTGVKAQGEKDRVRLKNWENWYIWARVCNGDGRVGWQVVEGGNKAREVIGARSWVIKVVSVAAMDRMDREEWGRRQHNQLGVSHSNPGDGEDHWFGWRKVGRIHLLSSLLSFSVLPFFCSYACLYGQILDLSVWKTCQSTLGVRSFPAVILARLPFSSFNVSVSRTVGSGKKKQKHTMSPWLCFTRISSEFSSSYSNHEIIAFLNNNTVTCLVLPGVPIYFALHFLRKEKQ